MDQMAHAYVAKCGFGAEDFVWNSLIRMHASCRGSASHAGCSMEFLRRVSSRRTQCLQVLQGWGLGGDVLSFFWAMLELGVQFDEVTLFSVLMAWEKLGVLDLGEWIDGYIE